MNELAPNDITDDDVERFQADGAICLRGMVDSQWLDLLGAGVERNLARPSALHTVQTVAGDAGFFLSDICMAQEIPQFRDFVLNGPCAAIAARLMRSGQCNFWADTLWVKQTGTPKRTRWHQDQPFFWVDGRQMCVVWCPLDPIERHDSLELIKGSHTWGKWFAPELSRQGQDLYAKRGVSFERMPDIEADRAAYDILSWEIRPGDCIAFHGVTVHGAPGNTANIRRRAISTIWMGDDTRYGERPSAGRPHFHGHDLAIGDRMDSGYFPQAWPRLGPLKAESFARFADAALRITN